MSTSRRQYLIKGVQGRDRGAMEAEEGGRRMAMAREHGRDVDAGVRHQVRRFRARDLDEGFGLFRAGGVRDAHVHGQHRLLHRVSGDTRPTLALTVLCVALTVL